MPPEAPDCELFLGDAASPPGMILPELTTILAWHDRRGVIQAIRGRHRQHVETAVAFWLSIASRRGRGPAGSLPRQLDDLPASSRLRVLEAPETYRRLAYPLTNLSAETVAFMVNALRAERCLLGTNSQLTSPAWSALGDAYFPAGAAKSPRTRTGWNPAVSWRAPVIPNGPALDGVSPFSAFSLEAGTPSLRAHTAPELSLVTRRVRAAARHIGMVRPGILDTVVEVTRVVAFRKTQAGSAAFASTSWPAFVGKTALVNAHHPDVTVARLANALLHEAIHTLLFMVETGEPLILDTTRVGHATVVSPWSGRALPVINYLHACLVWYGLWCFWRMAASADAFAPAAIAPYFERASSGFRSPSLLSPLAPWRTVIAPAALDSIRQAQETVAGS